MSQLKLSHFHILLIAVFLSACSTYSKRECESFNWDQRGYLSALKGNPQEVGLAHYYKECSEKHQVLPNDGQFKTGYDRGLKIFCTPSYAEKFGHEGGEYVGICSADQEKEILKPYAKGINIFYKNRVAELEREVKALKNRISSLESEKSNLESNLSSCQSNLNRL